MKKIFLMLAIATVAVVSNTYGQYATDALRFSQTNYGSSSRFKGMGGAQIGVGGDISSLNGNPAGLGLFTKSEFSLTPEFNMAKVEANYLGQGTTTDKNKFNINQMGAVLYTPVFKQQGQDNEKGLLSVVFGLGYARNNDYTMESNFNGANNNTSIADYFAELGGATAPNSLGTRSLERMAYDNYLISYDNVGNYYFPETFADATTGNIQRRNEIRSGSVSEFNFAAAANVSNKIYIGLSIGIINLKYNTDAQYIETGRAREYNSAGVLTGNNINYDLRYNQNQVTNGSGVNGRLGIIFRPVDNLRLGANIETPTWFVIDDSYTEGLDNTRTVRGTSDSETYDFTYHLRTPLKGSFGASYVFGGQALLSADIDFIDYTSMQISDAPGNDDPTTISNTNNTIRNNFQSAINYRIGGEYKIDKVSLRAGYALNGSPYKDDNDGLFDNKIYTGGIGYRTSSYYIDLAYQRAELKNTFSPYSLSNGTEPVADFKDTRNNVFLTLGFRF